MHRTRSFTVISEFTRDPRSSTSFEKDAMPQERAGDPDQSYRLAILGVVSGLLLTFLAMTRAFGFDPWAIHKTVVSITELDRYTSSVTLDVTIVPSGSTTTKNFFIGLGVADCSARSLAMEKSPLAIPDRIKLPNEIRFRIIGIATTIAATITDNRIKTILS
jgi:hypothetical protein